METTHIVNMKLLRGCHFFVNSFLTGRTKCILSLNENNRGKGNRGFVSGAFLADEWGKLTQNFCRIFELSPGKCRD